MGYTLQTHRDQQEEEEEQQQQQPLKLLREIDKTIIFYSKEVKAKNIR